MREPEIGVGYILQLLQVALILSQLSKMKQKSL